MKQEDKRKDCPKCNRKMVHKLDKDGFYYECSCGCVVNSTRTK